MQFCSAPWRVLRRVIAIGLLSTLTSASPVVAASLEFHSNGDVFRNGALLAPADWQLNGTRFAFQVTDDGIGQFLFQGDLNLEADDSVRLLGSNPISFFVGGDANIAAGAVIDASGSGQTSGAGGGAGGRGGVGGAGGQGGMHPVQVDGYYRGAPGGAGGRGGWWSSGSSGSEPQGYSGANGSGGYFGHGGGGGAEGVHGSFGFNREPGGYIPGGGSGGNGGNIPSAPVGGAGGAGAIIEVFSLGPGGIWQVDTIKDAERGSPGGPSSDGLVGNNGSNAAGGSHDAAADSLKLVGGNGGAGGGGGGGGSGASSGSGGGGGGGGAMRGNYYVGDGGRGGWGGRGGDGGNGGTGGAGGGGGGAFELRVFGRIDLQGQILARGANGLVGEIGAAGRVGTPGTSGTQGVDVTQGVGPDLTGNDGAQGGAGGDGGRGGQGGTGGNGGGGAGGTISLVATHVVAGANAHYDLSGGVGPTGASQGDDGRLLVGTTIGGPGGAQITAKSTHAYRSMFAAPNPFAGDHAIPETPLLLDLVGGPEAFGVSARITGHDLQDNIQYAVDAARNRGDVAVLVQFDNTRWLTGEDYAGYNALALINLTDDPLESPALSGVRMMNPVELLQGGWAHDPLFAGGGDQPLPALGGDQVFVTLIPESPALTDASASFVWNGREFSGHWSTPSGQAFKFLTIGNVPEPAGAALAIWSLAALMLQMRRFSQVC